MARRVLYLAIILFTLSASLWALDSSADSACYKFFANSSVPIMILEPSSGKIMRANEAAANLYGYDRQTIEGMLIGELSTNSPQQVKDNLEAAFEGRQDAFLLQHRRSNGQNLLVQVHSTLVDTDDGPVLFTIIHDVTRRETLSKELAAANRDLERAENIANIGHWVFDFNTNIVTASAGAKTIYGLNNDEWSIKKVQEIPLPEDRARLDEELRTLMQDGDPYNIRFRIRRANDDQLRYIHSLAEYDLENNTVFGIIHDYTEEHLAQQALAIRTRIFLVASILGLITQLIIIFLLIKSSRQRKRAQAETVDALREKDVLLREVHHRIKNNMATVVNLLTLQAGSVSELVAIEALEDARNRVQSMMLIYDRLYRSNNYQDINIKSYFELLVDEVSETFPNHKAISIVTNIEEICMDPKIVFHLGILVNELITNSLKYAFPGNVGGQMKITATKRDHLVIIEVSDNGIGIPASVDIHNPPGFGLNLVQILTEQIGATISMTRDKGTAFILRIPIV
ncbi:MAG: PAS domain S-box protein [Spirochaetaceae bacterium]|nr:MAG: PAS domain S-box protein [Spirochaetaceae bacterium]